MPENNPLFDRHLANKYVVKEFVGEGAMGAVYKAYQPALDKMIAVKILHSHFASDPAFVSRFWREAKAAALIDHENSLRVLDFGQEPDGLLFIAMEFLSGRHLGDLIAQDFPLSTKRIVLILRQVLAAAAKAHESGVVHRDLKPENIMILEKQGDDGEPIDVVKVLDFGIAKFFDPVDRPIRREKWDHRTEVAEPDVPQKRDPGSLGPGLLVGTPEYMSPEQAKGDSLDQRSDVYSIGVILYQMLTGIVPFDGKLPLEIAAKHIFENPPPFSDEPSLSSNGLRAVCLKAMEKEPSARYQTAREMRADLISVLSEGPPKHSHPIFWPFHKKKRQKPPSDRVNPKLMSPVVGVWIEPTRTDLRLSFCRSNLGSSLSSFIRKKNKGFRRSLFLGLPTTTLFIFFVCTLSAWRFALSPIRRYLFGKSQPAPFFASPSNLPSGNVSQPSTYTKESPSPNETPFEDRISGDSPESPNRTSDKKFFLPSSVLPSEKRNGPLPTSPTPLSTSRAIPSFSKPTRPSPDMVHKRPSGSDLKKRDSRLDSPTLAKSSTMAVSSTPVPSIPPLPPPRR